MRSNQHLYSTYQRIKNNCCEEWRTYSRSFYKWYEKQANLHGGRCKYCHLPGDTKKYYNQHFRCDRKGLCRRGINLEVDRKNNGEQYSPSNCVLACYPCNNAKSDVFSYEEFLEIGQVIGEIKKRGVQEG